MILVVGVDSCLEYNYKKIIFSDSEHFELWSKKTKKVLKIFVRSICKVPVRGGDRRARSFFMDEA